MHTRITRVCYTRTLRANWCLCKKFLPIRKKKTRTTFTSSSRHVEINDKQTILYMKITTMYTPDK